MREVLVFLAAHKWHLLIMIPGAVLFTIAHEGCHFFTAQWAGAEVKEFVWLPSQGEWGHVTYTSPAALEHLDVLVSAAPYIAWVLLCVLAVVLSLRQRPYSFITASTLFIWLFALPIADTANTVFPYLTGERNDFFYVFEAPTPGRVVLLMSLAVMAAAEGFLLQRRLYGNRALSAGAYSLLSMTVLTLIVSLNTL